MCGIFGFSSNSSNGMQDLRQMGDAMVHRGPDGDGYFCDDRIHLGMRRLSIIDVEHGNQPFSDTSGNVIVVCNGEIYNFRDLKDELQSDGIKFRSGSDIEVLPHLYNKYGISFVERLNGMFAMALYDKTEGVLYLIRDRLGIKPLYVQTEAKYLFFASEIKSLLHLNQIDKGLDFRALSSFLELNYIPGPATPFNKIKKLESGCWLKWDGNESTVSRYWEIPKHHPEAALSESEALVEMDELIRDGIAKRLISDVPLGSFLSGGVDSSLVTTIAATDAENDFSVFHMSWKGIGGKMDETRYAEQVLNGMKVNRHFREVDQIGGIDLIPELIYHLDEPFADAAFIPTFYLSKLASEDVKVILSGAGGDELFGGYPHHLPYPRWKSAINGRLGRKSLAHSYYDMWRSGNQSKWSNIFPWYEKDTIKDEFEQPWKKGKDTDFANAIMANDIAYYLRDDILFLTDKMSMAASIECRVPLLDHRLVELAQRIPSSLKIVGMEQKYILKKSAESCLPKNVLYRQKEGFGFPIHLWMEKNKDLYLDPLLEGGFMVENRLIDKKLLQNFIYQSSFSRADYWIYWKIVVLEIWFSLFVQGCPPRDIFDLDAC